MTGGSEYIVLPQGGHAMSMLGRFDPTPFYRGRFLDYLAAHSAR